MSNLQRPSAAVLAFEHQATNESPVSCRSRRARMSQMEPHCSPVESQRLFAPLHLETRAVVPTDCAAFHLNRRPQTLRCWAMRQPSDVPRPIRVNGRLAWRVDDLRRVLGVTA